MRSRFTRFLIANFSLMTAALIIENSTTSPWPYIACAGQVGWVVGALMARREIV